MSNILSIAALVAITLFVRSAPIQAQSTITGDNAYASIASTVARHAAPEVPPPGEKVLLAGKITNTRGVLPGAVVILTGSKQMAVTNANGEFEIEVPANAGPLQARVTYAGYADEMVVLNAGESASTVNLANATVIVVARRQRLGAYLKTARKQVRRDLRKVRIH